MPGSFSGVEMGGSPRAPVLQDGVGDRVGSVANLLPVEFHDRCCFFCGRSEKAFCCLEHVRQAETTLQCGNAARYAAFQDQIAGDARKKPCFDGGREDCAVVHDKQVGTRGFSDVFRAVCPDAFVCFLLLCPFVANQMVEIRSGFYSGEGGVFVAYPGERYRA